MRNARKIPWKKERSCRAVALCSKYIIAVLSTAFASLVNADPTYVVGTDRGGYLHDRLIELEALQTNSVRVEIRGRLCYSTCTLFLGLSDICVLPETTFGFHGPSRHGRPLTPAEFEYFSQVMSSYYPAPLKTWFLQKGRNRLSGVYKIKGATLIRMGGPACTDT